MLIRNFVTLCARVTAALWYIHVSNRPRNFNPLLQILPIVYNERLIYIYSQNYTFSEAQYLFGGSVQVSRWEIIITGVQRKLEMFCHFYNLFGRPSILCQSRLDHHNQKYYCGFKFVSILVELNRNNPMRDGVYHTCLNILYVYIDIRLSLSWASFSFANVKYLRLSSL